MDQFAHMGMDLPEGRADPVRKRSAVQLLEFSLGELPSRCPGNIRERVVAHFCEGIEHSGKFAALGGVSSALPKRREKPAGARILGDAVRGVVDPAALVEPQLLE